MNGELINQYNIRPNDLIDLGLIKEMIECLFDTLFVGPLSIVMNRSTKKNKRKLQMFDQFKSIQQAEQINQSISQSINQSINQSSAINESMKYDESISH